MTKGKQGELQTHGSLISHHLLQFLRMSETEMVMMTEERMMVGLTVMVYTVLIFLILVTQ
jgi:hypothetical protein